LGRTINPITPTTIPIYRPTFTVSAPLVAVLVPEAPEAGFVAVPEAEASADVAEALVDVTIVLAADPVAVAEAAPLTALVPIVVAVPVLKIVAPVAVKNAVEATLEHVMHA
jgi:hypothetical protein